jgi:DHA1 family tetracycline resistance protein-like MFS transporter
VATGLCAANFLLACFILPETRKPTSDPVAPRPRLAEWLRTMHQTQVGLLVGLFFIATFCFACYECTLALLVNHLFHYDQEHVGYLFAYGGVISVLVQGGMIRRWVQKWGEPTLICVSFFLLGVSLILLPYSRTQGGLLLGLTMLALGSSTNRPPTFGMISMLTPAADQGSTLGIAQSAGSLARILGPIFAASLFDVNASLPYLACGIISLLAGVLAWQCLRNSREIPSP